MKELEGSKWGSISEEIKEKLLENANYVDGVTGNNLKGNGECIVDLTAELSVAGKVIDDKLIIDDNAIIYNPENGIRQE